MDVKKLASQYHLTFSCVSPHSVSIFTEYLLTDNVQADYLTARHGIKVNAKNFFIRTVNGYKFVPSIDDREDIIRGFHDDIGHWDFRTTYAIISMIFWWPKVRLDVSHFVRICNICQKFNPLKQKHPFGKMPISGLFHTWSIDFSGLLFVTKAESQYILISVEQFSGCLVASPFLLILYNGKRVVIFIEKEIAAMYGYPKCIVNDKDKKFDYGPLIYYAKAGNITWNHTSAYNPEGSAKVKRIVETLKCAIRKIALSENLQ